MILEAALSEKNEENALQQFKDNNTYLTDLNPTYISGVFDLFFSLKNSGSPRLSMA